MKPLLPKREAHVNDSPKRSAVVTTQSQQATEVNGGVTPSRSPRYSLDVRGRSLSCVISHGHRIQDGASYQEHVDLVALSAASTPHALEGMKRALITSECSPLNKL